MATTITTTAFGAKRRRSAPRLPGWLREPLLHFFVLGTVLFAVDKVLVTRADDPNTIVVGAAVDNEARQIFEAARGHPPSPQELAALRQVWLDNEVLYREGLELAVDKGDTAIRERVIFKALSVVDANVKLPPIDDSVLRAWFESHRDKYDEPPRYDFQEAALVGTPPESDVRSFVTALNSGTPGDAQAGLRVFKGRPYSNIVETYGAEFAQELERSTPGEWRAMETKSGLRAMQLESITPAQPAVFEVMAGVVLQDWKDAVASEQRSAAVRELTKKYKVVYPSPAE